MAWKIKDTKENDSKRFVMDEDASYNVMSGEFWERRFRVAKHDEYQTLFAKMLYHFYVIKDKYIIKEPFPVRKLYNINPQIKVYTRLDLSVADLFPRRDLKYIWNQFGCGTSIFLPSDNELDRLLNIYEEIMDSRDDDEAWFNAIQLFKDVYFVEHNMEDRIGNDLMNKKLWHAYLDYLEENDHKTLLQTFSKYVRVFQDENDMIERYRKAAAKYGPVLVPWKNPLDFEIHDKKYFEKLVGTQSFPDGIPQKKALSCMFHFKAENVAVQKFSLPTTIIAYIREAASAATLQKLYQCCKIFYIRRPMAICYKMRVSAIKNPIRITGQSIEIATKWFQSITLQRVYIASSIQVIGPRNTHSQSLSNFMSKICHSSAKFVSISNQMLSLKHLKFLTAHKNFQSIMLENVKDENGEDFLLDDLLEIITRAHSIKLENVKLQHDSIKKLLDANFHQKIFCFRVEISGKITFDRTIMEKLEAKIGASPFGFSFRSA